MLADKIIFLRKRQNLSQEELAFKLDVSRQSVSKWESGQSIPDIEKLDLLSEIFNVSIDYLIKDDEKVVPSTINDKTTITKMTMSEVKSYLHYRVRASWWIAVATSLLILSPILLLILNAISIYFNTSFNNMYANLIGVINLFIILVISVSIYVYFGLKSSQYKFLEYTEIINLEKGVFEFVKDKQKNFKNIYFSCNIIATAILLISLLPLIIVALLQLENLYLLMTALSLFLISIAIGMYIVVGIQNISMEKILQEKRYTKKNKFINEIDSYITIVFWSVLTAIYLAWSFIGNAWYISWIVYVVGAFIYYSINICVTYFISKKFKNSNKKDKNK